MFNMFGFLKGKEDLIYQNLILLENNYTNFN